MGKKPPIRKTKQLASPSDKSVTAGRDSIGNVNTTGDGNEVEAKVEVNLRNRQDWSAASVDIQGELARIRAILDRLGGEHANKIGRALDDAEEEVGRARPSKDEVGAALERALKDAKEGTALATEIGNLAPHIVNAVAWLGSDWNHLLSMVGLGA